MSQPILSREKLLLKAKRFLELKELTKQITGELDSIHEELCIVAKTDSARTICLEEAGSNHSIRITLDTAIRNTFDSAKFKEDHHDTWCQYLKGGTVETLRVVKV